MSAVVCLTSADFGLLICSITNCPESLLKVILSRKGFDSANGGVASPILPGGTLVPLPIPAARDPRTYGEVAVNGVAVGPLVEQLTGGRYKRTSRCHLDPDLDSEAVPRIAGWRPAFGQINSAQSHLARHAICKGDLFLFFGWFREAEQIDGRWRFVREAPNLHVIYGWMEVDEVINLAASRRSDLLAPFADHPHLHGRSDPSNTLYLASERLHLPRLDRQGGGMFREISGPRVLTDTRQSKRSTWRLPQWLHPDFGTTLSYNETPGRWQLDGTECTLSSAARGQEFVLATANREATEAWLGDVFGAQKSALADCSNQRASEANITIVGRPRDKSVAAGSVDVIDAHGQLNEERGMYVSALWDFISDNAHLCASTRPFLRRSTPATASIMSSVRQADRFF
ncbi:MAG: hypothetical protein KGJ79_04965 [Alphaproteobacteria bacterium]|nr:hypothetical protein [Alphaproteobacteria bacterium]MDE2110471.1 hypothetical protein [Alphaproteobacteria bacterium]MDE2493222.1 hypothetical protein [Alphaproteobacteria bacterium]